MEGYTPEDYNGKPITDVHSSEECKRIRSSFEWAKQGEVHSYEVGFGEGVDQRIFEIRIIPLVDPDGEIRRFIGAGIDMTERVRQREQIEHAKQEWERTFDAIEDQVVILDRDYRILRVNRPVAEYLGLSFQQLVGKPCYELFQREAVCLTDKCPHTHCIKTRSPVHYESKD